MAGGARLPGKPLKLSAEGFNALAFKPKSTNGKIAWLKKILVWFREQVHLACWWWKLSNFDK